MLYGFTRIVLSVFTRLICRCSVSGRRNVPISGPLLIVANHLSWYDPILLGVVLPRRVWFFTKQEVFQWPLVGLVCRLTGQIVVHRGASDRAAIEKSLGYLRDGKALVIFPEGTVERKEQLLAAHTGAAMLALRTGAPVLPIALVGTRRILRSLSSWLPRVKVQIGEPFVPALTNGLAHKVQLRSVTQEIMERIAEMLPEGR